MVGLQKVNCLSDKSNQIFMYTEKLEGFQRVSFWFTFVLSLSETYSIPC